MLTFTHVNSEEMSVKQVIVFRRDLKVRKGKVAVQVAHAAMMFLANQLRGLYSVNYNSYVYQVSLNEEQQQWIRGNFTKICLVVDTEEDLRKLHERALAADLTSHMVIDAGLTEFAGVPTLTCIAIGPHESERINAVTNGLDLF